MFFDIRAMIVALIPNKVNHYSYLGSKALLKNNSKYKQFGTFYILGIGLQ